MDSEVIFLGHDNKVDIQLKADGSAASLGSVTGISLTFGATKVQNSSAGSGAITWSSSSYSTGQVRLDMGGQAITAGKYHAPLVVYDSSNASGIVWGFLPVVVMTDPEGT